LYAAAIVASLASCASYAQTTVERHDNRYTPAQDAQIGREAAKQVRQELPMLDAPRVDSYIEEIGRRLVAQIPPEFRYPEFSYTFDVVNQREINAFALPGGPVFVNRGMIEAASEEGQVAGVLAHEISHVALRHGTAQATKAQGFQIGAIAGQILGAIVGGTAGSIIAQGSQFGLSTYFLKYSREYEREADLLGARIMAAAGYDPREMAEMFRIIEKQSRSGAPEWLSSHPNPGNRYEAITREAQRLEVKGSAASPEEFRAVKRQLDELPPAYTAEQIARAQQTGRRLPGMGGGESGGRVRTASGPVPPPSDRFDRVRVGNVLALDVPGNWERIEGPTSVTFAPENAFYRSPAGSSGFTHGVQVGIARTEARSHRDATDELIEGLRQGNPRIRRQAGYTRDRIDGRPALTTTLTNESEVTGSTEVVRLTTVPLRDGSLLYLVAVAPEDEAQTYLAVFQRMKQSASLRD
jgi:hypothetical protein